MRPKLADLMAAALCALWAVVVLPLWRPASQLLNDDFLLVIGPMIGFAVICILLIVTAGALTVAARLVNGDDWGRLRALVLGVVTTIGGFWYLLAGVVPSPSDRSAFATWLLATVGGPLIVVLVISSGLELRRTRTRLPASPTPAASPAAALSSASSPATLGSGSPGGGPAQSGLADDYWVRAPASTPSRAGVGADPFWEDLSLLEGVAFVVLAAVVVLGAVWTGGRYRVGAHPVAGLCMIMGGLACGVALQAARNRRRAQRYR